MKNIILFLLISNFAFCQSLIYNNRALTPTIEFNASPKYYSESNEIYRVSNAFSFLDANTTTELTESGFVGGGNVLESQTDTTVDTYAILANSTAVPTSGARFWIDLRDVLKVNKKYTLRVCNRSAWVGGAWANWFSDNTLATTKRKYIDASINPNDNNNGFLPYLYDFNASDTTGYLIWREASATNNGGVIVDKLSIKQQYQSKFNIYGNLTDTLDNNNEWVSKYLDGYTYFDYTDVKKDVNSVCFKIKLIDDFHIDFGTLGNISIESNVVSTNVLSNITIKVDNVSTTAISDGWHNVYVSFDRIRTDTIIVGKLLSDYSVSLISFAKFYNYSLKTDELNYLNNNYISEDTTANFDIYIIAGQSNASGYSNMVLATSEITGDIPNVYIWADNKIELLNATDSNNNQYPMSSRLDQFGMDMWVAERLSANRKQVLFIKYAVNGSDLANDWGAGLTGYTDSLELLIDSVTTNITAKGLNYNFKGIVWYQGEGDMTVEAQSLAYETNITALAVSLRAKTGAVKFYAVRPNPPIGTHAYKANVRTGIANFVASDGNAEMINIDGISGDLHPNRDAIRAIGYQVATQILY